MRPLFHIGQDRGDGGSVILRMGWQAMRINQSINQSITTSTVVPSLAGLIRGSYPSGAPIMDELRSNMTQRLMPASVLLGRDQT